MFNLFFRRYVPGFRVGPDGVPGFDIDDNGLPRRATASFDGTLPEFGVATVSRRGANTDFAEHQLRTARCRELGLTELRCPGFASVRRAMSLASTLTRSMAPRASTSTKTVASNRKPSGPMICRQDRCRRRIPTQRKRRRRLQTSILGRASFAVASRLALPARACAAAAVADRIRSAHRAAPRDHPAAAHRTSHGAGRNPVAALHRASAASGR